MHKSITGCVRTAGAAVLYCSILVASLALRAAEPPCTAVTTRFVGVPATNCVLPALPMQLANPACEISEDGFPNSFLQVTLTNVPAGYSVTNGMYRGWCVDYAGLLTSFTLYKPIMYLSTAPLPPHLANTNWDMVNYLLNHKQGTAIDVQAVIWRFIGGPVPSSDPVFYKLSAAGSNMLAEATAFGEGFVPGPGDVSAIILDLGPVFQLNIIEVRCPGILNACPGGSLNLCTTNRGSSPVGITWLKDGVTIPGAIGACLNLTNLRTADAGVYTIRVTNACSVASNWVQLIVTNTADNIPPVMVCAPGRTYQCLTLMPPAPDFGSVSAVDNSGPAMISFLGETIATNGCDILVTRRYMATDPCGNISLCNRTDTARDTIPPVLVGVPPDATYACIADVPPAPTVSAVDNCDTNLTVFVSSSITGTCPKTLQTRWWAIDRCGNAVTNLQTVVLRDTIPPGVTCPPDITVPTLTAVPPCYPSLAAFIAAGGSASDNCSGLLDYRCSDGPVMGNACTGFILRTHTISDSCSNATSCIQRINFANTQPPVITCPSALLAQCVGTVPPCPGNLAAFLAAGGTVAGSNLVYSCSDAPLVGGSCGGTILRTHTVIDGCSNRASCPQIITVRDTIAPVMTCAPSLSIECGTTWIFTPPAVIDNCDNTNVTLVVQGTVTNRLCGNTYSATRTWMATDHCTNSSLCSQTITVVDTTPPTLTCAKDQVVECGTTWVFTPPTASDTCDGTNVAITVVGTVTNRAGFCGNTFSATRTWRATDACTNTATCKQTITLVDTTPPSLTCARDQVVECSTTWAFTAPTASDTCDGTNVAITVVSTVTNRAGFCGNTFSATRTWRATDTCTNTALCSQTILVVDTTPPTLTCAPDRTVECGAAWSFSAPGVTDNCDTNPTVRIVSTVTNRAGFCGNTFSATRTWEALDACTNRSTCSQTVRIVDVTPPVLNCGPAVTVECGTAWAFTPPAANDVCDGTNVTITIVSTTTNRAEFCGNTFSATRIWQAVDQCTNVSRCSQTITVVDLTPPGLTCAKDQVVECGTAWAFTPPTASDGCDGTNVTISVLSTITNRAGFCGNTFSVKRTWRAVDACANAATCSQTITIVDTTAPVMVCAKAKTVECGDPWNFDKPTASDICDGTNVTIRIVSTVTNAGSCPARFVATRTWEAADACTNVVRCSQTVTLMDTTPPDLACGFDKVIECGTPWTFEPPDAWDLCDGTNITIRLVSTVTNIGFCPDRKIAVQTWEAVDACTNVSRCSQVVRIIDTMPPDLIGVPGDETYQCLADVPAMPPVTADDLCDGTNVLLTATSTMQPAGCGWSILQSWTATDACTNTVTRSRTITVRDTLPPSLTCAPDKAVECGAAWSFDAPRVADNCDTNPTVRIVSTVTNRTGFCGSTFSATRTWEALDACTNRSTCSQTVRVADTTPPALSCAPAFTVECGVAWTFAPPTAIDACDGTNVTITVVSTVTNLAGMCGNTYSATRTWQAFDSCTNTAMCSQTVTVVDRTAPSLSCAADLAVECGTPWTFTMPTASDGCNGTNVTLSVVSTITNRAGFCGNSLSVTRTWRGTDPCSNAATCSQTITVMDLTAPVLSCSSNKTAECGSAWNFDLPSASDLCSGTNVTIRIVSTVTNIGGCPAKLVAVRTWEAVDACTNVSRCNQTVTVVDTTAPAISCSPDLRVECGTAWAFSPPNAHDICDGTNVTIRIVSTVTNTGVCPVQYAVTRTWEASDQCTNRSTCSQTITIVDTTPPVVTCGTNFTVECGSAWNFTAPVALDLCSTNVTIEELGVVTNALCGRTFAATRSCKATDACGNSATNRQTVTVVDTTPPVITCQADRVVQCGANWQFDAPAATDLCDGTNVAIAVFNTLTNPLCGGTFRAARTWKATDSCGNTAFCTQTLSLVDTVPPVLVGVPPNTNYQCLPDVPVPAGVTAVDTCDANVVVTRSTTTNGSCPTVIVHTWTAKDACSNSVTASQTITVRENPPIITRAPSAASACLGSHATFCVTATSGCGLTYQWRKDNAPIPGATNSCYTVSNAAAGDVGSYCVTVRSPCESVSACASLTLLTNISIGPVPALPCLVVGTNVSICPPISGSGLYQCAWYKSGAKLSTQSNCCLQLPFVFPSDAGTYTLYVTGACNVATADYIVPTPVIQCSPTGCDDQTVCVGATFQLCETSFSMFPGVTYGYQWYRMTGVVSNALPGETNQCLIRSSVTAADAGFYGVSVIASAGGTTCTQIFCGGTIQVPANPVSRPLADYSVCAGASVQFCTDPGGPSDHFTFEWRHNGAVLPGATNNCLPLTNVTPADAGQYCVLVSSLAGITNRLAATNIVRASGTCGTVLNCGSLNLLTNLLASGPTNQTVCPGSPIALCATASGTGPFSYLWRKGGVPIPNQTGACLTIASASASDAGQYCVVITSPNACNSVTNCASVTVLTNTTATPLSDAVVCAGGNVTFSTVAAGTGPFTYQWLHDGIVVPGAVTGSLSIATVQPTDAGQYCVRVTGACGSITNCARLLMTAALGDFVWEDINHNGRQDPGEPGLPNATVQLMDCASNVLATTTTDGSGFYLFSCLNPGGYRVRFMPPAGYTFTLQDVGGDDLDSDANASSGITACTTLNSGETNRVVDAGLVRPACLGDFVWEDLNGNGIQDAGEPGIANVMVRLCDCSASTVLATTTTGPNGEYLFCGLIPGSYRVEILVPAGYTITTPNSGTNDCVDSDASPETQLTECVNLLSGQTNTCLDIGLTRPAALGDFVWHDLDNNGRQDAGEPGMSNVTVRLMDCGSMTVIATTTTDATGHYLFNNLTSGTYQVLFVPPAGYLLTKPNAVGVPDELDSDAEAETGLTGCYTLLSGQTNLTVDAGLFLTGCLGDFVWEDLNGNGRQDIGEPGISNVTLRVIDCTTSNVLATTTTGPNGEYLFCGLTPGSYRVEVIVPGGYSITTPNAGTNDCVDSDAIEATRLTDCVSLLSGTMNLCVDIGLKRFAAIGDIVWNDLNMNGRQDAGEPGISNVTVRLFDCGTMSVVATLTTDGSGRYLFANLTAGVYKVSFTAPPGFLFTTPNAAGVNDAFNSDADAAMGMTGCYTLVGGQTNKTVDAGLFLPANPCIDVIKTVACLLPGDQCGPFGKTATGFRAGTNNPAFCYSITVSNCGGWPLTNLTLIDNQLGDLTGGFFATKLTPLPPASAVTRWYKLASDVDTTNTVVATARAAATGAQQVSDNDLAIAFVDNAGVSCRTIVSSPDDQDASVSDGHVTLVDDGQPHEVTFTVIVCNSGDADLAHVVIHAPGLDVLGCVSPLPFDLPVGACRTNVLCVSRLLCTNLPLSLTNFVTAMVDTRNNHCGYDILGSNLVVRSECHMEVECGMPGACRVTGGGRQENTYPSVRYMTHGGQVGAPVGRAGFDPDSRCIHGNWEVVRHDKGGTRGNFHAKNFDSLMCACLACAEDPSANVVIGGLCNPDNRICGPEPRKAPGNKICFSGVGDFTLTSGNRQPRSVLFRVDIEDRSEPGNSQAGGQKPPPDRHRIRIWILTDAEMARLNNPADRLLDFRFAISCSPASTALQDGAIGADGLAVPLGTAVFGVRPPDIDDGGEMDHGNHQIHPMIKNCP